MRTQSLWRRRHHPGAAGVGHNPYPSGRGTTANECAITTDRVTRGQWAITAGWPGRRHPRLAESTSPASATTRPLTVTAWRPTRDPAPPLGGGGHARPGLDENPLVAPAAEILRGERGALLRERESGVEGIPRQSIGQIGPQRTVTAQDAQAREHPGGTGAHRSPLAHAPVALRVVEAVQPHQVPQATKRASAPLLVPTEVRRILV